MLRFPLLLLLAVLCCQNIFADEPRYSSLFVSANGLYEARLDKDRNWQVVEKKTGRLLYTFRDSLWGHVWLSSMTLLVSDDGQHIVAIDDYSTQRHDRDPEILVFFKNGEKFKAYRLDELINPKFLEFSVSHFRWCLLLPKALKIVNDKIEIKSNELITHSFDVTTGKHLGKVDDDDLIGGSAFVYGQVYKLGNDQYRVKVVCSIRGNFKRGESITFTAQKLNWLRDGDFDSWIIRDGNLVSGPFSPTFNNCTE